MTFYEKLWLHSVLLLVVIAQLLYGTGQRKMLKIDEALFELVQLQGKRIAQLEQR